MMCKFIKIAIRKIYIEKWSYLIAVDAKQMELLPIHILYSIMHRWQFLWTSVLLQPTCNSKGHARFAFQSRSRCLSVSVWYSILHSPQPIQLALIRNAKIIFLSKSEPTAINLNCLMFCFTEFLHAKTNRIFATAFVGWSQSKNPMQKPESHVLTTVKHTDDNSIYMNAKNFIWISVCDKLEI